MERVRKVVSFDRDWLNKVNSGESYALVMPNKGSAAQRVCATLRSKKTETAIRSLKDLGELLTIKEAARILKVTERAVYEWVYGGKLRSVPVGRLKRIAMCDLEEFLSA